jgi:hypothetical protein
MPGDRTMETDIGRSECDKNKTKRYIKKEDEETTASRTGIGST